MKKTFVIIAVLVVVGIGAYYIIANKTPNGTPAGIPPTISSNPNANTPSAETVTIKIKNFSFNPLLSTIKTGAKVTWVNNDTVPHTVTSDDDNLFDSGNLSPGQSFSFIFTNTGSINYHCKIHPTMKGAIVIEN